MKRQFSIIMLCMVFCGGVSFAQDGKAYRMGSFKIPLFVEDAERGAFVEILQEISKRTGIQTEVVISSTVRTRKMFCDGELDALFPALDKSLECSSANSAPFYSKDEIVFVRQGAPIISEISQLEGKVVGVTRGYTYGAGLTSNSKLTLEYADSDLLNMRKLSKGRIDAVVVEKQSGLQALQESGATNIAYDLNQPLSSRATYFAFQDTDEGRSLAATFSKAINDMTADGTLQAILSQAQ